MTIPDDIRAAIEAHARRTFPEEACGLLARGLDGELTKAYCLTNADRSPSSFTVDPDEHFAALRHAEGNGWSIAGAFHSHPRTAPVPSPADVRGALDPDWVHVIVGPVEAGPMALAAYRIRDGRVEPLEIDTP